MNNIRKLVRKIIRESMISEREVSAYHGSPYEFEKFTTSKMGTGEGAQAFGWGLYFTDLEDIAREYAERLYHQTNKKDYYDSLKKSINHLRKLRNLYKELGFVVYFDKNENIQYITTPNNVLNYPIKKEIDGGDLEEYLIKWEDDIDKEFKTKELKKLVYKVKLHKGKTPEQYDWLSWDKPIPKNQILKIKKQIERETKSNRYVKISIDGDVIYKGWGDKEEVKSGKDLYRALAGYSPQKEASLFLLRAGIDGIKYPAESLARGATSDTARGYNYVVFDENAVSIEKVDKI